MTRREVLTRDEGFTLIELLAASLIFALIFTVIGSIFLSLVRTHDQVRTTTQTTSAGQLLARSVDDGIRNSSDFRVTSVGADQLLVARTASNAAVLSWSCTAWYYSAQGDGSVRTFTSPAAIATPTAAQLRTWTLLIDGIAPRDGVAIFTEVGDRLTVAFDALASGHTPTAIDFTVSPLTATSEMSPC